MVLAAATLYLISLSSMHSNGLADPGGQGSLSDHPSSQLTLEDPPELQSWLGQCLAQIEADPSRAHVQAQIRRDTSTGTERILANHCLGLASVAMQRWAEAQRAFTASMAEAPETEARWRARLGAMAGNAAFMAREAQVAIRILNQAYLDATDASAIELQAHILVDKARVLVHLNELNAAQTAIAEAKILDPKNAEIYLLSASLMRTQGRLEEAQEQIELALQLEPAKPEIILEAGLILMLDDKEGAARLQWEKLINLSPNTPYSEIARDYLKQLESNTLDEAL